MGWWSHRGASGRELPIHALVKFATGGFHVVESGAAAAIWHAEEGFRVGLYLLQRQPAIPITETIAELRDWYAALARHAGGGLVDFAAKAVDGVPALGLIVKLPQAPQGTTYVASLTVPFVDRAVLIKAQCEEPPPTCLREAVVFQEAVRDGAVQVTGTGRVKGWEGMGLARTLAEEPVWDERFPHHPLTQARGFLRRLDSTATVHPQLRRREFFRLPAFTG